jgi:D-alanyl-D-alanine-carboxypeptidase/D-alanyl-D-alanine-endopeptidase
MVETANALVAELASRSTRPAGPGERPETRRGPQRTSARRLPESAGRLTIGAVSRGTAKVTEPSAPRARHLAATFASLALASLSPAGARAEDPLLTEAVNFAGAIAFLGGGAPALVIAAIKDRETAVAGFGETVKGSGTVPDGDTFLRIASISKAVCGDVLGGLAAEGALALTDPLQDHLPPEYVVPQKDGRTLRLIDLVTQASGLPREVPNQVNPSPENGNDDPFGGNTPEVQIAGLEGDPYLFPPGTGALYSNWGYDLLGAALAHTTGKPYADLLTERVLAPRGMADTKFNLAPGDEARAMQGHNFDGSPMPWVPSPVTIECAGGLYTTAHDMLKWLAWHLDRDDAANAEWRTMSHAAWLWRDGLAPVGGLDDGGPMGAMALGWVVVLPDGDAPLMLNKSGGLQGQFSYVVIAPTRGVGVFTSINQFSVGGFEGMVQAANGLVAELSPR